jgi:hypothetical protein
VGDDPVRYPKIGGAFSAAIQNEQLMSNQRRLGDDGAKAPGSQKPEDDDDYMQKKCEDVAHARDGIKPENPKNSAHQGNSPPTR